MKNFKEYTILILSTLLILFISVYLFQLPSFIDQYNLANKDKLGTAISGLTAPVLGLLSTILLYTALTKQIEANKEQRLKNESDIIFLLINQLDTEINSFRINQTRTDKNGNIFTSPEDLGAIGIWKFCESCNNPSSRGKKLSDKTERFDQQFESANILLIIESYLLIEARINSANLTLDVKKLFQSKMKVYYDLKLKEGLEMLVSAFIRYQVADEDMPKKISDFIIGR